MQFDSRWSQFSSQFGRGNRSQTELHCNQALLHCCVHAVTTSLVSDDVAGGSALPIGVAHAAAVKHSASTQSFIDIPPCWIIPYLHMSIPGHNRLVLSDCCASAGRGGR
jgi:hypothetical protein